MNYFNFITSYAYEHVQSVTNFFNSVFVTSIAGALAGAFFGALGAQRIAERSKQRDELLKEIRRTNAAISLAFYINNTLLSFKKQQIKPLKDEFDAHYLEVSENLRQAKLKPKEQRTIHHRPNFRSFSTIPMPIPILQDLGFSEMSVGVKILTLISTLANTIESLNQAIEGRNRLIEFVKQRGFDQRELLFWYFGLEYAPGSSNREYTDTLQGVYVLTDDGIYFSQQLSSELVKHGESAKLRFERRFGGGAPVVATPLFTKAEQAGLMPDPKNYEDWNNIIVDPSKLKTDSK
jgi:hypothetical protein